MSSNKNFLVVPMHLDALYLAKDTSVVTGDAHFERLPYATTQGDFNPDTPNISESIASPPFSSSNLRLGSGIHLHWALPDALTHGKQETNNLKFPVVPNRWLVVRTVGTGAGARVNKWIVESDYIHPENVAQTPHSITYPYQESGRVKPYTHLGRTRKNDGWSEAAANNYLLDKNGKELTAVGYGHPNFAGFYPNCYSNFGFHDASKVDTSTTYTYEVMGWYSDVNAATSKDYLQTLLANASTNDAKLKAIKEELLWAILNQEPTAVIPNASLYYARLTIKNGQFNQANPGATASNHQAIVGNTGTEALSAYLANTIKAQSNPATRKQIEEQLEATQLMDEFNHHQLDLDAKFYEARHDKGFRKVDAGTTWVIRSQSLDTQRSNASDNAQDHAQITLPIPLAHQLNLLNALQNEHDQALAQIESYQKQLYADWYKYQVAKYPPSDQLFDYPDPELIEEFIKAKDLYPLQEKLGVVANLQKQIVQNKILLETSIKTYNRLHTHAQLVLQAKGAPRYYEANDPVILLVGEALKATNRFGQDGRAREDGLLGCVLLKNQTIDALRGNLAPLTTIANAQSDFTKIAFNKRSQQPWNPLMLEWEAEVFPYEKAINTVSGPYKTSYLQDHYDLKPQDIDLQPKGGQGVVKAAKVFSGKTNLSPASTPISLERLRAYFQKEFSPFDYAKHNQPNNEVINENLYRLMIAQWDQDLRINVRLSAFYTQNNIAEDQQNTDDNVRKAMIWYIQQIANIKAYPTSTAYKAAEGITIDGNYFKTNADIKLKKLLAWHISTSHQFDIESFFIDHNIDSAARSTFLDRSPQVNQLLVNYLKVQGAAIRDLALKTIKSAKVFIKSFETSSAGSSNHNLSKAYGLLSRADFHAQGQSLGGFNDALLMHKQTLNLSVSDPLGLVSGDHTAFIAAVKNCLAGTKAILSAPQPQEDFLPIRTGELRIVRLRLVDTFGQTNEQLTLRDNNAMIGSQPFDHAARFDRVSLTPRFSQPARLNFRWLAARNNEEEFNQHPATTPVCGWVLPNYLDESLDVYDQNGVPLGVIRTNATWASFPGSHVPTRVQDITNKHLRRMVQYLITQGASFLTSFIGTVQTSLINIEPEYFSQHQDTALLIGRPIALVRAKLNLELRGLPAYHQEWNVFRQDLRSNSRHNDQFTKVKIPVRLGEYQQLNDGLVGYWKEQADGSYEQNYFYAPEVANDSHALIRNNQEGTNLAQSIEDRPVTVSMLVDIQGKVHATSGVLPTKSIDIPKDQYQDALKRMVVAIRTMPVLTPKNAVTLTLPSEEGYQWEWIEKTTNDWTRVPLEPTVLRSHFTNLFGQVKGVTLWRLLLNPAYGWLQRKGEVPAYVVPIGQRKGTLDSSYTSQLLAIEQALTPYKKGKKLLTQATFIATYKAYVNRADNAQATQAWNALITAKWLTDVNNLIATIAPVAGRLSLTIPSGVQATKSQLEAMLGLYAITTSHALFPHTLIQRFGANTGRKLWQELESKGWIVANQRGYRTQKLLTEISLPAGVNTEANLQITHRLLLDVHPTVEGSAIVGRKASFLIALGRANGETIWQYLVDNGFVKILDEVAFVVPESERNQAILPATYDGDLPVLKTLLNRPTIQPAITKVGFDNSLVLRDGWLTLTPTLQE